MVEEQASAGLSKEQKIGVILLSVFSVFAIGLGILQIRNTMYAPFSLSKKIPPLIRDDINSTEALMYRDTDKDGLNDFDELYVYATSPYLADTDSDGLEDKAEVDKGSDPLCAEGQSCGEVGVSEDVLLGAPIIPSVTSTLGPEPSPEDINKILSDPAQVRKILLDSGLDKKIIDATSDADLMKMVKDILSASSTEL
ncbi:MAG: Peptidoglycan-associated outer membrane protein [Parcubacteria group bacterium Gr01-1014_13]|nr:MAG: Peptidoglycan-associated outer membrane protein [Parcubacteria group bacterium Gr01-1014_13]